MSGSPTVRRPPLQRKTEGGNSQGDARFESPFRRTVCRAFLNSAREAAKKERNSAFGGGRTEWDPKNPHSRPAAERRLSGGTPVGSPSARKASARRPTGDGPSNPFDTKLLSMMQGLSVPA
jgi:hypothetical protein